ncbi:tetratricopeptide repeat protein [Clostridium sp. UBA1056]|uniref:tetratricopeptide repeat protein n=1 Tax=unclassified Clostridium TaxID=2614128 RepID=UPI003217AA55
MDYNKFNIEEKYDSYNNITKIEAEKILLNLENGMDYDKGYDYYILKGKMLLKLDRMKEASAALEKALSFNKTDEVCDLLSFAYYEEKDYERALYYIDLSFEIAVDEYIYNHKGKILEKLDRFEEAFEIYYKGLNYTLSTYSSYGDIEIFGENLARLGGVLKNLYVDNINKYIVNKDYYNLYGNYMKLLQVILKEEENDHYHSSSEYVNVKYLELIEEGKYILIDNSYFLEMINIYKILYDIENNSEYDDRDYINKDYIDDKVKEFIDAVMERTSLTNDVDLIIRVLNEIISIKNKDYYGYIYHKGFIFMKLKRYDEGLKVLDTIVKDKKCNYSIRVQSYECIIKIMDEAEGIYKEKCNDYKKRMSELLKSEIHRLKSDEYLTLDNKCEGIMHNCNRAINLELDNEFWYDYIEILSLDLGDEYEVIVKNQSIYKVIENYNKAINIYDRLIIIKSNCAHGYYRKGRAIVLILRLLNSSKTSLKDLIGVHNLDCFSYSEVIYNLNRAISLKNDNGKYFNLLARTHFEIGEYDKSLEYMEQALYLEPNDLYMNINKVCIYIRRYQYTEAVDYLFKMSYKDIDRGTVRKTFLSRKEILSFLMGIFNLYQRQDKIYYIISYYFYAIVDFHYDKALTFINNAIEIADDERYYLLKAKIYFKDCKYKEALKCAEEAIIIDDHYDEAFLIREQCNKKLEEN